MIIQPTSHFMVMMKCLDLATHSLVGPLTMQTMNTTQTGARPH